MTQEQYRIPPNPVPTTSGWAIFSLIAGILAWAGVFGLGGLAAVICGHIAKNEIRREPTLKTGDGMATVGLILGYTNIALVVMGICLAILVFAGIFTFTVPVVCLPFLNSMNSTFSTIP